MAKDRAKTPKLLLTLPEYGRIYEVIYSVLEGRANTPHACMFFAAAGALILNKHYKIAARAVAGAFLLCIDSTPKVITIAKDDGGSVSSSRDGFHMWVQTETHAIDFMAPIFNEAIRSSGIAVPRKMFQRPLLEESEEINQLTTPGDYLTLPNIELTDALIESFFESQATVDLLMAVDRWFKKYPKKLDDLSLMDEQGELHKLKLKAPPIAGAW